MTKSDKISWVTGGVVAAFTIAGSWLAIQAAKLRNYTIKVSGVKVQKLALNRINMNVFFDFTNPSAISIRLREQEYDVYINDMYLTTLVNRAENVIRAKATSEIGVNLDINPVEILQRLKNPQAIASLAGQSRLKIVMRIRVRFGIFTIKLPPNTYEETISLT